MKTSIRAGKIGDISWSNGTWLILDIGFAKTKNPSCGLLIHSPNQKEDQIEDFNFNEAVDKVIEAARTNKTMNLVIEAPLSVAFDKHGNPIGRSIDKQGSKPRYWYQQAGCVVMVATLHLMWRLISAKPDSEIKLFEGFVSFKTKDDKQHSHSEDVQSLRKVIRDPNNFKRCIHDPADPALPGINSSYWVESAFKVAGLNFGVPLVIMPNDR